MLAPDDLEGEGLDDGLLVVTDELERVDGAGVAVERVDGVEVVVERVVGAVVVVERVAGAVVFVRVEVVERAVGVVVVVVAARVVDTRPEPFA